VRGRKLGQLAVREDPSRAGVEVGEAHRVAVKRVMIVERRGLGSRVRSEGARARAIGESLATSTKRSAAPEGLRCLSEPGYASWVSWVGDRINHLVQKPNAGKLHVRFDERDLETGDMVSYSGTGIPKGPAHGLRLT
jgi:hypothetical protein